MEQLRADVTYSMRGDFQPGQVAEAHLAQTLSNAAEECGGHIYEDMAEIRSAGKGSLAAGSRPATAEMVDDDYGMHVQYP